MNLSILMHRIKKVKNGNHLTPIHHDYRLVLTYMSIIIFLPNLYIYKRLILIFSHFNRPNILFLLNTTKTLKNSTHVQYHSQFFIYYIITFMNFQKIRSNIFLILFLHLFSSLLIFIQKECLIFLMLLHTII